MKMRNSRRSPSFHWMLQSYEKIAKRTKYFYVFSVFIHDFCIWKPFRGIFDTQEGRLSRLEGVTRGRDFSETNDHICRYKFANQRVLKFAPYHAIHGPLPLNIHLIIYTHACTHERAISRTTFGQSAYLSRWACSTHAVLLRIQHIILLCTYAYMTKKSPQASHPTCPRIENPTRPISQRKTRNEVSHTAF